MLWGILLYFLFTIAIGVYASKKVKNNSDFLLAGRSLPTYISTCALFALWFGTETILGSSGETAEKGIQGSLEDPIGASICLLLVGLFFARPLYRMNILTFGDFYKIKYNETVEIIASIALVFSYIGWIAAQLFSFGIILNLTSNVPMQVGIFLGTVAVVVYTFLGGMWSVSLTDFIQTIMILIGLCTALFFLMAKAEFEAVYATLPKDFFHFVDEHRPKDYINLFSSLATIGLGSIPQQDIFQRVMSCKSEKVAVLSSILAGFFYLTIGFIPVIIAIYGKYLLAENNLPNVETLVPNAILSLTNPITKVLFFGALLSAVMSTSSGAILAPASILSENILNKFTKNSTDSSRLFLSRISVLLITLTALVFSFFGTSIHTLVGDSSSLSLVCLFVPLVYGLFSKNPSSLGAILSIVFGFFVWTFFYLVPNTINPLFFGLVASFVAMWVGSFIEKGKYGYKRSN